MTALPSDTAHIETSPGRSPLLVLTVVAFVGFVTALDNTIVAAAAPSVARDLGIGLATLQWVSIAYMLPYAGLVLLAGTVLDRLGDRALLAGLGVFAAGAVVCGAAGSAVPLLLGRTCQGVAAAFIVPGTLRLLRTELPERLRATAAATWTAALAAALALGPWLGGVVSQYLHWSWIFYGNLPFVLPAVVLVSLGTSQRDRRSAAKVRLSAALAVTSGLVLLTSALVTASEAGAGPSWSVPLLGVLGALLLAGFVLGERCASAPLVPPRLLRGRVFPGANVLLLLWGLGISGVVFFTPLVHQSYLGLDPGTAGLPLVVVAFGVTAATPLVGPAARAFGTHRVVACGLGVVALGLFGLAAVNTLAAILPRVPALLLIGAGSAFTAPITSHALDHSDQDDAGTASGVLTASRELSSAFGVAVVGLVVSTVLRHRIATGSAEPAALAAGYTHGVLLAALLQVIAAVLAWSLLRPVSTDPRSRGATDESSEEFEAMSSCRYEEPCAVPDAHSRCRSCW
ncbi:Major Facilitator Superfamily protein [Actinopolyspora mzabensis]|uniref:Major Facilitator Superfamily protein n=1 Tax=Actinopolyspora mzabensis TaxID=995066 RepID=A0A1G9DK77_ACTMZ|nr:MFS transporter [Actinopolyspora mzabensis]SDK64259.1 Major Facilitator Superfamily protein [Actinopolyspora mzabensis]